MNAKSILNVSAEDSPFDRDCDAAGTQSGHPLGGALDGTGAAGRAGLATAAITHKDAEFYANYDLDRRADADPDEIILVPRKTSAMDLGDFNRGSLVFGVVAAVLCLAGLPAWALCSVWGLLDLSSIFTKVHTGWTLFWLFYLFTNCWGLIPLLALGGIGVIYRLVQGLTIKFIVSNHGVGWDSSSKFSRCILASTVIPVGILPWSNIACITMGKTSKQFIAEHDLNSDVSRWANAYSGPDYLYFVYNTPVKVQVGYRRVCLLSFSDEQKHQMLRGLLMWASGIPTTPEVIVALGGSPKGIAEASYTQLWLQLLEPKKEYALAEVLNVGDTVGRFEISQRLSTGGQANLYRGRSKAGAAINAESSWPYSNEEVVLKQYILSNVGASARLLSVSDFENEFMMLSRFQSENIVRILDIVIEGCNAFLVLESVAGMNLRQRIEAHGPQDEGTVRRVILCVARALDLMHSATPAVVHRDVSPENILFDAESGIVKLIDFSLAMEQCDQPLEQVVGKQSYISPQQFRGDVDVRNDIYALGATMFFLLTGIEPQAVTQNGPRRLKEDVSDAMNSIVLRCTNLELTERYQSAQELINELESVLNI